MSKDTKQGFLFIFMAGVIWSTLGLFGKLLLASGLTSQQIAFTRLILGFIFLFVYTVFKDIGSLKAKPKYFVIFALVGLLTHCAFNVFYFKAIELVGVSIAAVTLYTQPFFLAVFSKIIYKEKMSRIKVISLVVVIVGAFLAVTGGKIAIRGITTVGIVMGILSAIAFALMPTLSKPVLGEVPSSTLLLYSFLFGTVFIFPIADVPRLIVLATNIKTLMLMLGLGFFPAAIAYVFYAEGIRKGVELSIVGIISTSELIFSQIIGWVIFGEPWSIIKILGIVMMVMSTVMVVRINSKISQ